MSIVLACLPAGRSANSNTLADKVIIPYSSQFGCNLVDETRAVLSQFVPPLLGEPYIRAELFSKSSPVYFRIVRNPNEPNFWIQI